MKKVLAIVSAILFGCLSLQNSVLSIRASVLPKEADKLAQMRIAGLHHDRTMLPELIDAITPSRDTVYKLTALQALAQMGAVEALPKIEVLEKGNDFLVISSARSAKARLIAENSVITISDNSMHARALTDKFYEALGLNPTDVSAGVFRFYSDQRTHPQGGDNGPAMPVEVYAMREVADMVYRGSYKDFAVLPAVSQLNYSPDYPSALKLRLAPLSESERINMMVQELAKKEKLATNDDYEIQLLADEGLPASHAIAIQLSQMDTDRQQYKSVGFAALFRALEAIGDREQAAVIARFSHDADGDVGYFARQVYDNVNSGLRRARVLDY